MTLLYKPLGLLFSVLGGIAAGAAFRKVWMWVANEPEAPKATDSRYPWREVAAAAAIEGAIFGLVKATIDRSGARAFQAVTGTWPGD